MNDENLRLLNRIIKIKVFFSSVPILFLKCHLGFQGWKAHAHISIYRTLSEIIKDGNVTDFAVSDYLQINQSSRVAAPDPDVDLVFEKFGSEPFCLSFNN